MNWIRASLVAALFLGIYELCTKHAVARSRRAGVFLSRGVPARSGRLMVFGALGPGGVAGVTTASLGWLGIVRCGQVALVASSWMFTNFAKSTAVSIPRRFGYGADRTIARRAGGAGRAAPPGVARNRDTWRLRGGLAGQGEGISFRRNRWIGFMVMGTLLGAVSSLYDKYLLGHVGLTVPTVQAWFSVYLAVFFLPLAIGWKRRWWARNEFHWRWSIPCIGGECWSPSILFRALQTWMVVSWSRERGREHVVAFHWRAVVFASANGLKKLPPCSVCSRGIVSRSSARAR
jgi:hypothetical protein